ncbi:hypothetical protein TWF788_009736 [Orbilia oligospora]|uniref:Uncharacterized protein n=1 Tax=Orbilia oligospora TaxID=2813651 RepID=A0A7C8Q2X3_ORBOL|nr:hypothetical protein TWF788_009736 [Orbilia oligospora]
MAETTMDQSFGSFVASPSLKRKRSRRGSEAMTNLRTEAAKVVRKKLGLHIEPRKVTITCKPFPKRKTVYLWTVSGDLDETELNIVGRTINSESIQRRYFRSWSDHEREQLTSLIKRGAIVPEYYVNKATTGLTPRLRRVVHALGSPSDSQSAAWELVSSDTEDDDEDAESEYPTDYRSKFSQDGQLQESTSEEHPAKRSRESSTGNDNGPSPDKLVQTTAGSIPESQPIVNPLVLQTSSTIQTATRCSLQPSQSPHPRTVSPEATTSQGHDVIRVIPAPPPRTMSLNANGILELDPMPSTTIPSPTVSTAAPIAASPFTPITNNLALFMDHNQIERALEDEKNNEMAKNAITDMEIMMKAFISHATIGFLNLPRVLSEKRVLKREKEEKESHYEERLGFLKRELEGQVKLACDKESMFKGIISSLETANAIRTKEKGDLEKQYTALQREVDAQATVRKDLQHRIGVLEKDLARSKVSEKHLQDNETIMKDCYQRLGAEHDKLKETADIEAQGLKQRIKVLERVESEFKNRSDALTKAYKSKEAILQEKILALEKKQSELENRLETSADTHKSKETALQEKILGLESKLHAMAEKQTLLKSILEDSSNFLQI